MDCACGRHGLPHHCKIQKSRERTQRIWRASTLHCRARLHGVVVVCPARRLTLHSTLDSVERGRIAAERGGNGRTCSREVPIEAHEAFLEGCCCPFAASNSCGWRLRERAAAATFPTDHDLSRERVARCRVPQRGRCRPQNLAQRADHLQCTVDTHTACQPLPA